MFYRDPLGLPVRWQDEQSGGLSAAILAYMAHASDASRPFDESQRQLVTWWCQYYIQAPCWMNAALQGGDEAVAEIQVLIDRSQCLQTAQDIKDWINACLAVGIDPL